MGNVRNPYSLGAFGLATFATRIGSVVVARSAHMADVMHSAPRFLERPIGLQQDGRLDVARVAVRILVQLGRLPRTALAANVVARLALLRAGIEHRAARMADAPDSLAHRLADEVRPARARRHRQRRQRVARQPKVLTDREGAELASPDLGDLGLGDARMLVILLVRRREARAFLAAQVLAIDAHLVRTEGGLAAVAGAVHAHADRLGDPGELEIGGRFPLAGLQRQAVLAEEGARLLPLHGAIVGAQAGFGSTGRVADRGRGRGWGWGWGLGRRGGTIMGPCHD